MTCRFLSDTKRRQRFSWETWPWAGNYGQESVEHATSQPAKDHRCSTRLILRSRWHYNTLLIKTWSFTDITRQDPTADINPPTNERRHRVSDQNVSFTPYPEGMRFVPFSRTLVATVSFIFILLFLNFENVGFSALRHFGRFVRVRLISIDFSCFTICKTRSPTTRMICQYGLWTT